MASPAAAHEGTEPDEKHENLNCAQLAELYEPDAEWIESKIADGAFPADEGEYDYTLSDRGTPDDTSDDAVFTLIVTGPKNFDWTSNVGLDAIFVKGGNAEHQGSYAYYFRDNEGNHVELTEDVDYTVPPYNSSQNAISHITICWDDENPGTTTSSSSTTSTTAPPTTDTTAPPTSDTTAPPSSDTSATSGPTTAPSSTAPSTTISSGEELPKTGSNITMTLIAVGAALLAVGAALVFGTRRMWNRHTA